MGDQSKHMATRAVSTCTRMMILGLFLGVLAVTSEPTDMHDPGQVEAKLTNEVIPESEWGPLEFLERPARGSDKKPPELQLSQSNSPLDRWGWETLPESMKSRLKELLKKPDWLKRPDAEIKKLIRKIQGKENEMISKVMECKKYTDLRHDGQTKTFIEDTLTNLRTEVEGKKTNLRTEVATRMDDLRKKVLEITKLKGSELYAKRRTKEFEERRTKEFEERNAKEKEAKERNAKENSHKQRLKEAMEKKTKFYEKKTKEKETKE